MSKSQEIRLSRNRQAEVDLNAFCYEFLGGRGSGIFLCAPAVSILV